MCLQNKSIFVKKAGFDFHTNPGGEKQSALCDLHRLHTENLSFLPRNQFADFIAFQTLMVYDVFSKTYGTEPVQFLQILITQRAPVDSLLVSGRMYDYGKHP